MGEIFPLKKSDKKSDLSDSAIEESDTSVNGQTSTSSESFETGNIDRHLVTLLKPRSFEAEQFRILRTKLLFPPIGKAPRAIMITSAVSDEGKSFVAANFAISIAQTTDRYVLLVDCDMRAPSIHKLFGFGDTPGLSEYLSEDVPLSSLLLRPKVSGLSILPGGIPPPNPSELLSSEKMSAMLKEVKARYNDRYIIIDSPPPLLMAGTAVIARQVDGVIIVVKYGSTPQTLVAELIESVEKKKSTWYCNELLYISWAWESWKIWKTFYRIL